MKRAWLYILRHLMASRWRLPLAVAAVGVLAVFGIGMVTLSRSVFQQRKAVVTTHKSGSAGNATQAADGQSANPDQLTHIKEASFSYLTPKLDPDWDFDLDSLVYDASKELVRYVFAFHNSGVQVAVTQQPLPAELMPRTSAAFDAFIQDNKVSRSQDVGQGTVYFLPALKNGVPGAGSDTIIFATDSILMFAKADSLVGYDPWLKYIEKLQISSP